MWGEAGEKLREGCDFLEELVFWVEDGVWNVVSILGVTGPASVAFMVIVGELDGVGECVH